jgi:hypothetical protein
MDLQTSKLELVKMIVNTDNQAIINKLLLVFKSEEEDFWLKLSEHERQEIELGINQLDSGQRISLDDFIKKVS